MDMKPTIYKIWYHVMNLLALVLWLVMMIEPEYIHTIYFKICFLVFLICLMIYTVGKEKYFPQQPYSKAGKIICTVLTVLLFFRFMLF